jgi:hypothetical protein
MARILASRVGPKTLGRQTPRCVDSSLPERPSDVRIFQVDEEAAMKYPCLVYLEETQPDTLSTRDLDTLVHEPLAYGEALRTSGHCVVSDAHDFRLPAPPR